MAGEYAAVKTALKNLLASIDGSGSFSIDLSGSNAISEERYSRSATSQIPRAYLTPGSPATTYRSNAGYNDLSSYGARARFDLVLIVERANTSDGARVRAAEAAMNDVLSVIESDRDLQNSALETELTMNIVQGSELGSLTYGIVYGVIEVSFLR